MNRYETAYQYHKKGYSCAQSVVWAFGDLLPIPVERAVDITSGFGVGAGTGEICGALSGAIVVLGLLHPVDPTDPVASKRRGTGLSKVLQTRFKEKFRHIRCQDLLSDQTQTSEDTPAALSLGITKHCDLMVITAVELLEAMLQEEGTI